MTAPIGPILDVTLRYLDCGCCVDDNDAIWSPCRAIAVIHAEAMEAVRAGVTHEPVLRSSRGTGARGDPVTLRDRLDDMARHVRRMG